MTTATAGNFQTLCRQWRQYRKLSQLDLALAANVSQRHVSWLENGRSAPSRDMVVRLSEAMDIPLRERNALLQSAGYTPIYRETDLSDPAMGPVLDALERMLRHHEPLPAVVVDRYWNLKLRNRAADLLLGLGGDIEEIMADTGTSGAINLALLTLHPQGLRRYISNWEQAAPSFVRRLRADARALGDQALLARFEQFIALSDAPDDHGVAESLLPVLPLEIDVDGLRLSLFTVMSTIGTAQDITADELRLEAFYPADADTEAFFRAAAAEGDA